MLIAYKDKETERLLNSIGSDTPVKWMEYLSGVKVVTSRYKMLDALSYLVSYFVSSEFASMEDFYGALPYESIEIPEGLENCYMSGGWCYECCTDWDGPWIYIEVKAEEMDGEIIFVYRFNHAYCDGFQDCMGCDSHLNGRLEGFYDE